MNPNLKKAEAMSPRKEQKEREALTKEQAEELVCGPRKAPHLRVVNEMSAREYALMYAARGYKVAPLRPGRKDPYSAETTPGHPLNGGVNHRTTDPDKINGWFDQEPNLNWGLVLGGKTAVDVDTRHGDFWEDEFHSLVQFQFGDWKTMTHGSANDGFHLIYWGETKNGKYRSTPNARPAIDIITGPTRYVVGPGSIVDGKKYRLLRDRDILKLPDAFAETFGTMSERPSEQPKEAVEPDQDPMLLRGAEYLAFEAKGAEQGNRNNRMVQVANALGDKGVSREAALPLLLVFNEARITPPLEDSEVETAIEHAYRYRKSPIGFGTPEYEFEDVKVAAPKPYLLEKLGDFESEETEWFWNQRMALGCIGLLVGQGKRGKSQLSAYLSAVTTTGGKFPDGAKAPKGSVILIGCEDHTTKTIMPRLEAAGADLDKVYQYKWTTVPDGKGSLKRLHFDVHHHAPNLQAAIKEIGDVVTVIFDPISAYFGKRDSHKLAEVREAMAPMQSVAEEENVCIVAIAHLNKNTSGTNAADRVSGSNGLVHIGRFAWLVDFMPEDEELPKRERRRYMAPMGSNDCRDDEGFIFKVVSATASKGIKTSKIEFQGGPVPMDADDMLKPRDEQRQEALEFLRVELAEGPKLCKVVEKRARAAGISKSTLRRAREQAGIKREWCQKSNDWIWSAPQGIKSPFGPLDAKSMPKFD